jgi:predicted alpha/beta-fold hydrolase
MQFLAGICRRTLLLSAYDDPFLPRDVLVRVAEVALAHPLLTTEFHEHGGHVGFLGGRLPWLPVYYADERVAGFLSAALRTDIALSSVT